ncbi:ClpXP protease specificity-enhancing factor [Undibacterium sp. RTI2.1]|uniref:ClpXP protease specificity-enhancing factor n=1 Tax=unclassified Undibacterium TaxID=2630295 RepID=UPI002AB32ED7|nr:MULTISPECIES: ClpXP protease specificity-enhancing factor [unclassified Undibacterium]MDY7540206.1 ClpXP protease specificity-enhancing factor [Undibacterium sp. 5I1]MEB0030380.1 ClpXP protease specificity-enhancing factor [Undibacterium sp. RTI2.1]MEB0115339.1 ClpXP protease specificity-enhancing factor [Undibacterium sp. RTI2.2]MEB0232525.1 ClpXP protease specificity-enhancing factor [Undibacterium sp. 10I3]MEB0257133.1 ClpXP protease specificity-enhancing factor [Undibacterium sp. 5I1]
MSETSTKPYFMRAIYEWCTDNGYTPYMAVKVNAASRVPMEFVRNGEIVLNISFGATSGLKMDNEAVTFKARFGGISRDIYVPVENVQAVYASENGQGMAFEVDLSEALQQQSESGPVLSKAPASALHATSSSKPVLGLAAVNTKAENNASASAPKSESPQEPQKKSEKPSLKIIK